MKGKLFGSSSKNRAQQNLEISQPYPQHNLPPPPDPRNSAPLHYQRIDPSQIQATQEALGRSPSQRRISSLQNLEAHNAQSGYGPPHQQGLEDLQQQRPPDYRQSAYLAGGPPAHPSQHWPEEKERRGLRDRLGLKHSKDIRHEQGGGLIPGSGPGRKLSVRGKNSPNPERYSESDGRGSIWGRQSNSSQLLLSPTEEDEEAQHNRFVNPQAQFGRPPVPAKDSQDEADFQQAQERQQDYYPPPGSQQVPVGQQFRGQGSGDQVYLSPEQQIRLQQQQQQNAGQYGPFAEHQLQQLQNQKFQHYPPPPTHVTGDSAQNHPQGPPPGYLVTSHDQQQTQQSQLQHSPEDPPQQYPLALRTQAPDQEQEQEPELHQPQANRLPPGQQDGPFLQAPPVATKAHGSPSPIQVQQADSQAPVAPDQTPSPNGTQPDADSMPNPSRTGGGAIRSVDGLQGQTYRGQGPPPEGRTTPGVSEKIPADMTPEEIEHYHQLMRDHKELKDKYQKVKKYYFEKESQVHELQNTLANQRLSASRTSLDDSEYTARFNRLDGLISQLAFSIRKSWISVPEWLHRAINKDAIPTGKQEMTAVGRAFISWWLYSEVFERIFHPDLDPHLSIALKSILNNIRRFSPPPTSEAEEQSMSSKLVSWRMTTVEGIQDQLRSPQAQQHRAGLLEHLNAQLIGDLSQYLSDPAPPDLAGGVFMIVELAANIICHLPLESREVVIEYYPPLCRIQPEVMKLEQGIPALTNPILGPSLDDNDDDSIKDTLASDASREDEQAPPPPPHKDDAAPKGKRGMLANLMGAASGKQPPSGQQQGASGPGAAGKVGTPGNGPPGPNAGKSNGRDTPNQQGSKEEIVRLSVGLGVGIRGRSVLVRAPVFTTFV